MNSVNSPNTPASKEITLAHKLNDWLKEAEGSTSVTIFRRESMEDYKFYSGDQDTKEVRAALEELKRPATVYNEVKPKIDMLVGLGAQMKQIPYPIPVTTEDDAIGELLQGVYRHYRNKLNCGRTELSCFEHMVKAGESFQHFWIDASNPFKPQIKTGRVSGRDIIVDPTSTEYDMEDARFLFRDKWLNEEDIKIRYPNIPIDQIKQTSSVSGVDRPKYYDVSSEKYRLVECWYRKLEEVVWFVNPMSGKKEWLRKPDFKKFNESLVTMGMQEVQQGMPAFKRNIYFAIFSDNIVLEEGASPFRFDSFPYVRYGAYKDEDNNRWFGAITVMKDPQRNLNTMRRQLTHLLQTAPRGILQHETGAILNVEDYETRGADPTYHMEIAQGKLDKVKFSDQPQISPIYQYLDGMNSQGMKDTSGIQDPLMGVQTTSREPGVSVQMRQESNIAVLHILFSNYKESRRLAALQLMSLIQQYVTEEEVIRIEGQQGMQLLTINSQTNPQVAGYNDVSALEYDIVIDEDLESTTTRLATMRMLADFGVANPGMIPPDVILEYGNLPMTVIGRVKAFYEQRRAEELALEAAKIDAKKQPASKGEEQ